jgi:outer membrane protein OmpA-like peptidoglycan-associated protein
MRALIPVLLALSLATPALAREEGDPEADRLGAQIAALEADAQARGLGEVERLQARQAIAALRAAASKARPQALYLAERRVQTAVLAVQAEQLERQAEQLDRERDQILVEASRQDAERARREADRLRMQNLARQEEAARLAEEAEAERQARAETFALAEQAKAEAEQARRLAAARAREAELARQEAELASSLVAEALAADAPLPPSRPGAGGTVYTLAGNAFASGRAALTTEAQASLRRLAAEIGGRGVTVVGYTDSQGTDAANQRLSQNRADAVAAILKQAGASGRVTAEGRGEADPVADNATADGRARNRRVEITVQ